MNSKHSQLMFLRIGSPPKDDHYNGPPSIVRFMKDEAWIDRECIWVLHFNTKLKLVRKELVAMGSHNCTTTCVGLMLRSAVIMGTPRIVTVHNHPSGDPKPSPVDLNFWRQARGGSNLLGIELIDNIIIGPPCNGRPNYYSEYLHGKKKKRAGSRRGPRPVRRK